MSGSEALDLQLADLGYTGDAAAHFRALARAEVARLRAVEKAARMASEAWGRDSRIGPPYLFHTMVALTATLEAKP